MANPTGGSGNTRPVPNVTAALGTVMLNGKPVDVFWKAPWSLFWQQFVQQAAAVVNIADQGLGSPYTPNQKGNVIITGASSITLVRGTVSITLTGQKIIPMSIGDTLEWTGNATVQFLGDS